MISCSIKASCLHTSIALYLTLLIALGAQAQMPLNASTTATPVPGVGHNYLGAIGETVNPATGSTSIRISVAMPPGRGLTLPFSFAYDSNGVNYVSDNFAGALQWMAPSSTIVSSGGWSESVPTVSASQLRWTAFPEGGGKGVPCFAYINYVYQDPQGGRHNLNLTIYNDLSQSGLCSTDTTHWPIGFDGIIDTQAGEGGWSPNEGAIISYIPLSTNGSPITVTQPDGTIFYFPQNANNDANGAMASKVEDRNGNTVTITPPSSPGAPYSYSDTLGRVVLQDSGFAGSSETVTVPGVSAPYSLAWTTLSTPSFTAPITTLVGTCGLSHASWVNQVTSAAVTGVSGITLPNGRAFTFAYDSTYHVVNKITYPTGGYVRYVWGMNAQAEFGGNRGNQIQCGVLYGVPVITDRYESFDGSTEILHQHFAYSTTWNTGNPYAAIWTSKQTTVTTTDSRTNTSYNTVYTYAPTVNPQPDNSSSPTTQIPVESSIAYYDTNGALLRTVSKVWVNPRIMSSQTITYPTGQSSETLWNYNAREMQIEQDDKDFGTGGVGPLLRKTITNYQQFGNTPLFAAAPSIVNRPCQVVTYDSSGTNRVAETDYFYDNGGTGTVCGSPGNAATTSAGGSSLTGHDVTNYSASSTSPRGNLTAKIQWLNTGPSPLTAYGYDETGQAISMTDPNQNQYAYSYADNYLNTNTGGYTTTAGSPPSGKVTNAYLTQITRPAATGPAHITKFAYGYDDGELTQITDENSQLTTYRYNDSLGRLAETDYPDTGQTSIAFNDSVPSVTTTKLINSSTSLSTTVTLDGLNHPIQAQLTTDPMGATSTATVYDGLGRTYESFNPTRCSPPTTNCGSETTWGFATYSYDGLGRTTSVLQADNSIATTSYSGNCSTVTDEAGKSRKSCVDGLGRMTGAWEDPAGVNYETDYTYDALGNVTYVNQKGNNSSNARTRSFQYDSLSRLTTASNPESGTITYGYDANGNVLNRTAPLPNQTGSATVVTSYTYDQLNRNQQITYSDGTPPVQFTYDIPSGWENPAVTQNNIIGRLSMILVGSPYFSGQVFGYDPVGRLVMNNQCTPSTCNVSNLVQSATYDLAGDLTSSTNSVGTVLSYAYNGADWLTTVTSNLNDSQHPGTLFSVDSSVGYYPTGAVRKANFGNGLTEAQAYNNRLQPCRMDVNSGNGYYFTCTDTIRGGNLVDFTMGYNSYLGTNNGNVISWSAVGDQTFSRSYGYDSLNRIQSMSDTASGQACKGLSFTIDPWTNLTAQSVTSGTCFNFQTTANTNNRLVGYQYDAAGNMTSDGIHTYTYDAENRIVKVDGGSTASYVYNEAGERVRKNIGSTWIEYVHGPGGVQCEYNGSSCTTQYVYAGSRLIAEYNATTTEFIHSDSLGSTRLVTSVNQSVLDNLDYLPFGQQIAGGAVTTHKFTSKERDGESNLDNFGARYFTSTFGRFMTPDWAARPTAVPYAVFGDPQSLNLYAYVRNDPVTRADEDGHQDPAVANATGQAGLTPAQCGGGGQERCATAQLQTDQAAQNTTLAQVEEPEREEERPEEQAERALEPVEAPAAAPAATTPNSWDTVLSRHSAEDIQAVRNGADSVDPQLAGAIRQKDAFDAIATGGMKVTSNPLGPNQEVNITITSPYEPGVKLNLRVETHPLTPGGPPVRHVNVERVEPGLKNRPVVVSNTHIDQ